MLSVTLLSTHKQNANQLTENKRLSSCAVFSDANINWREIEIPLGLHCLLMPKTPLGLHVNQKRESAARFVQRTKRAVTVCDDELHTAVLSFETQEQAARS